MNRLSDYFAFVRCMEQSWTAETAYKPELWTPKQPARGQCVPSSLIAQDVFGGNIIRCRMGNESHYYLANEEMTVAIDLTGGQYRDKGWKPKGSVPVDRDKLLSQTNVRLRYLMLRDQMAQRGWEFDS